MIRARESKSAPVGVVAKLLRILETLDSSPAGLQLREIAQRTGINKSTAYRFLAHLEGEDYLFRDDDGAYIVGPKLARLGSGLPFHATLRKVSRPVLTLLAQSTTETVNLGVLEGHEVLYLDVLESSHSFRMASLPGARRPLHCTALGKAILAFLPAEQREELLPTIAYERLTPHTICNPARLRKDLVRTVQQGYAIDNQETNLGAYCVAAPIIDESGKVAAAVSVSGPVTRMGKDRAHSIAVVVRKGARQISASMSQKH